MASDAEQIQACSQLFDELCQKRWDAGAEEYGPVAFIKNDVIRMMIEEMADIANYARMQTIKLLLLQSKLEDSLGTDMGADAFKGTGEGWPR